jgi:hypothetical protein
LVPARRRYWYQLQASKAEARLAVDLHNRSGENRRLEAFIVHMSMAWLKLLQACYDQDEREKDLYLRGTNGRRQRTAEGDWLMKPLQRLLSEAYSDTDPTRRNVEFFLGLRHKIEHRHDRDVAILVAGKAQAIVLNYERELVRMFGVGEGLSDELRFPIFLSTITDDAVESLKTVRARTSRAIVDYIQDFDAALEPGIASSDAYDFRVVLIPQLGPKSEADVAMTFVRLDELEPDQRAGVENAMTIIREKQVPVSNLGALKPGQVATEVQQQLELRFSTSDHTRCWQHYGVRPAQGAEHPERTKSEFCRWDEAFEQYTYTKTWIAYLVRRLGEPAEHSAVLGREPQSHPATGRDSPAA